MRICAVEPAVFKDRLLDGVVGLVCVCLKDFVQIECAASEGGKVFSAQRAEQLSRVVRQRICAVNDFLTERLVASLRIVKRRGENQSAAIAVLAVSFVALHG